MSTMWRRIARSPLSARLVGAVLVLALWEAGVRGFAPSFIATPSGIVAALPESFSNGAMLRGLRITLVAVAEGVALSAIVGIFTGLAMGRLPWLARLLRPYVEASYATPMVAILPLLSIWFGYSANARLATIIFAAIFPFIINGYEGSRAVPVEFLEVARSFRAGWLSVWFTIALPSALPYLIAGLRLAVGRALVAALIAEFFVSIDGIGYYILSSTRAFAQNRAFVAVILLAFFALAIDWITEAGARRLLPWFRRDAAA